MWSTIFTAASTVMGNKMLGGGGQSGPAITAADAKAAINFTPYKMQTSSPEQAGEVGSVGGAAQYNQLLAAWDSYLNNEYLEMSKRIIT
tara:strand:+ start:674 stop:940 length:267 start_codon:yes stop_codon:yes gene_type:complete